MMENKKTYIIAEAGVNHNGDMELAKKLVEQAAKIGADAIKFQTFVAENIVHPEAPKAKYQEISQGSNNQYELLKNLELPPESYVELQHLAEKNGIDFLSTPFDLESLDFLISLGIDKIKISSGDLTNGQLLLKAAQKNKKLLLSTGMATMAEIKDALLVLFYGYLNLNSIPKNLEEIRKFGEGRELHEVLYDKVVLFHCTSEYPAPFNEINLNALTTIADIFKLRTGYSDHSLGVIVPCLAVAKGAEIIEKHFTLDNNLPGPDHKASLDVEQFEEMIKQIRLTEEILGNAHKSPTPSELKNKKIVRRGIYASCDVKRGEIISEDKLICLRPESKISAMNYFDMIGTLAERDIKHMESL